MYLIFTAIKKGEITPSVIKLLVDKDNTGLIFSDKVLRAIKPKRNNIVRSKSLRNTAAKKPLLKQTQSERHTDLDGHTSDKTERRRGILHHFLHHEESRQNPHNMLLDGMPEYNTKPVFTVQTRRREQPPKEPPHPCRCGSLTCRKKLEKMKLSDMKLTHSEAVLIACVCGSGICENEKKKIMKALEKAKKVKMIKAEQEKIKMLKIKKKFTEKKQYEKRLKRRKSGKKRKLRIRHMCAEHDIPRLRRRERMDKHAYKEVVRSKGASDFLLLAESLIDVGRVGFATVFKVIKGTFNIFRHPKHTCEDVRAAINDPCCSLGNINRIFDDQSIYVPAARVRHRFGFMSTTKKVVQKMESYPTTNYLLHRNDKNPAKRNKKFKKRVRPPIDFCKSLYLSSRAVKPCLWIYYICPGVYPTFISIINTLRQFCRILLFIGAFIVWSPCLLCMEICRIMIYIYCPFCMKIN